MLSTIQKIRIKKLYLVIVMGVCSIQITQSQSCLPEGITFSTQSQIDSFQINYPNCTEIEGDVNITGNNISNLIGLSSLTSIRKSLWIYEITSLKSLYGLHNIKTISESLNIGSVDGIYNFSGLNELDSIYGMVFISFNDSIVNFVGLDSLKYIGGEFNVGVNNMLQSFKGLENLNTINHAFVIYNNYILKNLDGLENLSKTRTLHISLNDSLEDISALQNLILVNGTINISENHKLERLEGIDNINADSISELYIFFNQNLSKCHVKGVCDYLVQANANVTINYNAEGCFDQEQVEEACLVSNPEITPDIDLKIFPNPVNDKVWIENLPDDKSFKLEIFDILGRKGFSKSDIDETLNISFLNQGIYYFKISSGNFHTTKLMVKN